MHQQENQKVKKSRYCMKNHGQEKTQYVLSQIISIQDLKKEQQIITTLRNLCSWREERNGRNAVQFHLLLEYASIRNFHSASQLGSVPAKHLKTN